MLYVELQKMKVVSLGVFYEIPVATKLEIISRRKDLVIRRH